MNVEKYVNYVSEIIKKYSEESRLIKENEVNPNDLNNALANYLQINMVLISEYQRAKIEHFDLSNRYEKWYDEKFVEIRKKLINEIESKTIKVALKEIETELRFLYKEEYYQWQELIKEAEYKVSFLRRLVEQYKKYDSILVTLSQNMRQEMRSLSVENRMNSDPDKISENRVRTRFPNLS